jgi:hypothetical protein
MKGPLLLLQDPCQHHILVLHVAICPIGKTSYKTEPCWLESKCSKQSKDVDPVSCLLRQGLTCSSLYAAISSTAKQSRSQAAHRMR